MGKLLLGFFMTLLFVGAAGVMNEMGEIQPICCVMVLVGAVGLFLIRKEFYINGIDN